MPSRRDGRQGESGREKKKTVNHRGSFREDFTSGWLSAFDNENTCIFIVARRSGHGTLSPSAKSNYRDVKCN